MTKKKILKLNLGSGINLAPGFTNVDKYFSLKDLQGKQGQFKNARVPKGAKFVQADMCELPFKDGSVDYIESFDAIEHVPFRQVPKALSEMYRVLRSDGKLCLFTTSFDHLAERWTKAVTNNPTPDGQEILELQEIIYGNQIGSGEFHTALFNPALLTVLLVSAGFALKKIVIVMYPFGCPDDPPMANARKKTAGDKARYVQRCDSMYVTAIK